MKPSSHPVRVLPSPGVVWGPYPLRSGAAAQNGAAVSALASTTEGWLGTPLSRYRRALGEIRRHQRQWAALPELAFRQHVHKLRGQLVAHALSESTRRRALGCVCAAAQRVLLRDPFDTQLCCAQALLDGHLAEMATGEGKTLAAALAAAVAALAGIPVHVMTANDYLAERDAQELRPLFAALGLRCGTVLGSTSPEQRAQAYACELTYATAREIAFDHLRDRAVLRARGSALQQSAACLAGETVATPLLRGLCMAVVDEADSLMIDEATLPLVLAETHDDPQHRAACFQALMLAKTLQVDTHVQLDAARWQVHWTEAGAQALAERAQALGGAWLNRQHRQELVGLAVLALHVLQRDTHYLVRDEHVQLLDAVTGRAAVGRVWSQGLQTLVELKEGCRVSPPTRTTAQTSYQNFFRQYLHVGGISGTLRECRHELRAVYGKSIVALPLRQASRRQMGPYRVFATTAQRTQAVVRRVAELVAQGRPVLVGVDTVTDAEAVSAQLVAAGVMHQVLDARHDAQEASIVAAAGQARTVTVATRLAGRGTDIVLGRDVVAAGGLHVLCCQDNRSARLDRQLIGRASRQGDPGSAEVWLSLEASAWHTQADRGPSVLQRLGRQRNGGGPEHGLGALAWPSAIVQRWSQWQQHLHQTQAMRQRRRLLEQDQTWQAQLNFTHLRA